LMREIRQGGKWLQLPDNFEIHEWAIMRDFVFSLPEGEQRFQLEGAIHGHEAFRMFRNEIDRFFLTEDWYAFRQRALERIVINWLDRHEIPFESVREE